MEGEHERSADTEHVAGACYKNGDDEEQLPTVWIRETGVRSWCKIGFRSAVTFYRAADRDEHIDINVYATYK